VHDSSVAIRAWFSTRIECYREVAVEVGIVTAIEDVYCVNNGWFE
jgi:hypothetical protein